MGWRSGGGRSIGSGGVCDEMETASASEREKATESVEVQDQMMRRSQKRRRKKKKGKKEEKEGGCKLVLQVGAASWCDMVRRREAPNALTTALTTARRTSATRGC